MHEGTSIVSNVLNTNCTFNLNGLSNGFLGSTLNDKTFVPIYASISDSAQILLTKALKDSTVSKFKPMPTSQEAVETFERVVEKLKRCQILLTNECKSNNADDRCVHDSARKIDETVACATEKSFETPTASASCNEEVVLHSCDSVCFRDDCCSAGSSEKTSAVSLYRLHLDDDDEDTENGSKRIAVVQYKDETQIEHIVRLITKDLSEPYSIYTYRYFIHNWPYLCFLVYRCFLAIDSVKQMLC